MSIYSIIFGNKTCAKKSGVNKFFSFIQTLYHYEKKVNNSININKSNNHFSTLSMQNIKTYDVENRDRGLGQVVKDVLICGYTNAAGKNRLMTS
jgi:hypothetical protein